MNMPMTSPELMLKLFKAREQELLKEAATARLVKDDSLVKTRFEEVPAI